MQSQRYTRKQEVIIGPGYNSLRDDLQVVLFEGNQIPPMHSGPNWTLHMWRDSFNERSYRATFPSLRLVRNPWTDVVTAEFKYTVENYREDLGEWRVLL